MCGRTRSNLAPEQVVAAAGVGNDRWIDRERYQPSNNVSPGRCLPVLRLAADGQTTLHSMHWGLVPFFHKHGQPFDFFRMFNARSETVDTKNVFKHLLPTRRCAVCTSGFYEWKAEGGGGKQPYFVSWGADGEPMWMAGLFDIYRGPDGSELYTCTILTVCASQRLEWLHDRMPALLRTREHVAQWLGQGAVACADGAAEQDDTISSSSMAAAQQLLTKLIAPYNAPDLVWWPVTKALNNPKYDAGDACQDVRTKKGTITSFFKPRSTLDQKAPLAAGKLSALGGSGGGAAADEPARAAVLKVEAAEAGCGVRPAAAATAPAAEMVGGTPRNSDEVGPASEADVGAGGAQPSAKGVGSPTRAELAPAASTGAGAGAAARGAAAKAKARAAVPGAKRRRRA